MARVVIAVIALFLIVNGSDSDTDSPESTDYSEYVVHVHEKIRDK